MASRIKEKRLQAIREALSIRFERYDLGENKGILFGDDECWAYNYKLYQWLLGDDGVLYRYYYDVEPEDDLDKVDWSDPVNFTPWCYDEGDIADIALKYCGPLGRVKIDKAFTEGRRA